MTPEQTRPVVFFPSQHPSRAGTFVIRKDRVRLCSYPTLPLRPMLHPAPCCKAHFISSLCWKAPSKGARFFYIYPKKPSEERLPRAAMMGALLCLPSVQTESPSSKRTVRGDFSLACLQKTARNPPLSTCVSTCQAVPR